MHVFTSVIANSAAAAAESGASSGTITFTTPFLVDEGLVNPVFEFVIDDEFFPERE